MADAWSPCYPMTHSKDMHGILEISLLFASGSLKPHIPQESKSILGGVLSPFRLAPS